MKNRMSQKHTARGHRELTIFDGLTIAWGQDILFLGQVYVSGPASTFPLNHFFVLLDTIFSLPCLFFSALSRFTQAHGFGVSQLLLHCALSPCLDPSALYWLCTSLIQTLRKRTCRGHCTMCIQWAVAVLGSWARHLKGPGQLTEGRDLSLVQSAVASDKTTQCKHGDQSERNIEKSDGVSLVRGHLGRGHESCSYKTS